MHITLYEYTFMAAVLIVMLIVTVAYIGTIINILLDKNRVSYAELLSTSIIYLGAMVVIHICIYFVIELFK